MINLKEPDSRNARIILRGKPMGKAEFLLIKNTINTEKSNVLSTMSKFWLFCEKVEVSCLNFWDEACWFLSLRVFGQLYSSLLLQ